jgi:acetolactate synthase I/II/III large subunit
MSLSSVQSSAPRTGAADLLVGLKANGIDYLFANAGTDFPPLIEALASLPADQVPVPVIVPHETASVAMAHGYYLVTGRPQATMVHVNVGLANSAMGVINAASDNIPVLILSGRTPITEHGRPGSRMTPIQYGQEMYDQSSIISNAVKFHYEMRYPEQGHSLASRAVSVAMSEPKGPAYISLPREPLAEIVREAYAPSFAPQIAAVPAGADASSIAIAAEWLGAAERPLLLCQRSDTDGRAAQELTQLAVECAIPVVEPFSVRNVMPSDHPMFLGHDLKGPFAEADVVLVVDSPVPWIESLHHPKPGKKIIHIGPDPLFARLPIRSYQTDLAIAGDPAAIISALRSAISIPAAVVEHRRRIISDASFGRKEAFDILVQVGAGSPMSAEWMSRCISDIMEPDAVLFSELGVVLSCMKLHGANRVFTSPHSGGLGWGFPAALGAQLAHPDRLCIACVGDGSYMFANPVACHQIAEALELPVLIIVKNNGIWNAVRRAVKASYPDGHASRQNVMPLTSLEPAPDYTMIARASRAYAERVEHGHDLPAALTRALSAIRNERRHAMLELNIAISDAQ